MLHSAHLKYLSVGGRFNFIYIPSASVSHIKCGPKTLKVS